MTGTIVHLTLAAALGAGGGALYFAALWHSVARLQAGAGLRAFALSGGLRLLGALAAVGLVLWLGATPAAILAALAGFTAARVGAARLIRPRDTEA